VAELKRIRKEGYTLLALIILVCLGGFALAGIQESYVSQNQLKLEQRGRETQILDHIQSGLLSFSGNQGVHSQSHLGHLPCPARQPNHWPETTCLLKPWGYLPTHSKTAVNYLNSGIDARNNELEASARKNWQYAVSPQLIQPNELGWSRWVNFSVPGMQVRIPSEDNRKVSSVAAVVAQVVTPIGEHEYDITPPYLLLTIQTLQTHITKTQVHLLKQTLQSWPLKNSLNQSLIMTVPGAHENLVWHTNNILRPVDSECSCRCTKTRCTCQCKSQGQWISSGRCVGTNPQCINKENHSECTSLPGQDCVFNGSASLKNEWPISRFEPVASTNKSCRPSTPSLCPLSPNNTACTCDFSWPDNTKKSLFNFEFVQSNKATWQVKAIHP
jgi:hypothetical protein